MWSTLKISSGAQIGYYKRDIPAFDTVLFYSNLNSLRRKYLSEVPTDKIVLSSGSKISKRPLKRGHWWLKNKERKCHFRFIERFLAAINCTGSAEGALVPVFLRIKRRKITDSISCHSKNLIYLIECTKCHLQYIGETKRQLNERFGEHRRSILNHHQLSITTPVSLHFNQAGHSINDVHLIPIELIRSKRDTVRKAREAHLINKAKTLHPFGINRRDETRQ